MRLENEPVRTILEPFCHRDPAVIENVTFSCSSYLCPLERTVLENINKRWSVGSPGVGRTMVDKEHRK